MPSRDDVWKAHYEKLAAFKAKHAHTKVMRSEDEHLYLWCYTQRKKRREGHISLTGERVAMLNDLGFIWNMQSGRPKKSDEAKKIIDDNLSSQQSRVGDGEKRTRKRVPTKRPSLKTIDLKLAAEDAAMVVEEETKSQLPVKEALDDGVVPAPEPNKTFLGKSFDAAKWVADGTTSLLKMFVSF